MVHTFALALVGRPAAAAGQPNKLLQWLR